MAQSRALGDWCVFVLALSIVSQMLRIGVGKPAVARVCAETDFLETNGFSFEPSKLVNVKCFGLCPLRGTSMCSARELKGGEQAEHTGMWDWRGIRLNSKIRELPKRKRAAVWGERSGAWGCVPARAASALLAGSTAGSCCSRGSLRSIPWTAGVEVSPRALPKFSLPVADVLSPAGLYALFHLLLAAPARGSPSGHSPWGWLAVLELPQLRQPLHPLVHSCQAESCVWEPVGALGVCPGAAKSRFCPQPLPGSGGVSGHCMVM